MYQQDRSYEYEKLVSELSVPDPKRRGDAAISLAIHGTEKDIPALKPLLNDRSEYVRVSAMYALCLVGYKDAVEKMIEFINNPRENYHKLAVTAMESISEAKFDVKDKTELKRRWADWWKINKFSAKWDEKTRKYII